MAHDLLGFLDGSSEPQRSNTGQERPKDCSVADKGDAYGFVIFSVRVSVETALAFTASGVKRRSSQPFCE